MAQSGAAIGCSECFRHTFLPLSGRERIDLDLGTIIEVYTSILLYTLLWYNRSIWYKTMVYVSYIAETEAVNANNICRKL